MKLNLNIYIYIYIIFGPQMWARLWVLCGWSCLLEGNQEEATVSGVLTVHGGGQGSIPERVRVDSHWSYLRA